MMKNYTDEIKDEIRKSYKQNYAVSEVLRELGSKGIKVNRSGVTELLKRDGIYEGLTGPNYTKRHAARVKKAMLKNHGVENYGQISRGFAKLNKIAYKKPEAFGNNWEAYRSQVKLFTARSLKELPKPDYCEYTGIRFADADKPAKQINPNDPIKRTLDHKVAVLTGYILGMPPEEIGSIDNLAYVIRHVNTIKSNTSYEDFLPIAEKLREVYINEGFESN